MTLQLSVVIPVKDDAPALARCLEHLARQTLLPFEIVVVDNGSADDSAAVAAAHGARVVPEPEPGIPAAAATGYDSARGDLIVRCDADSMAPPDWLERIHAQFSADDKLDALTGFGDFYDVPRWRALLHGSLYLHTYYVAMWAALAHPPLWGSNMAVRRTLWVGSRERVHRHDPELHDDVDLSFVLGPHLRIDYDRSLRVAVSGRSLRGGHEGRRRMLRAWRTLRLNWATMPPWERWAARLRRTADDGRSAEAPRPT